MSTEKLTAENLKSDVMREHKGPGLPCGMSTFLASKSREDALALAAIAFDDTLPILPTARVLQKHGYKLKYESIRRHREGKCQHCAVVLNGLNGGGE